MAPGLSLQTPGAEYPSSCLSSPGASHPPSPPPVLICSSVIQPRSPPPCYLPTGVGSQTMNARRKGAARVRRSSDEPAGVDQDLPVLVGAFVDDQREIPFRHLLLRDPRLDEHADSDEFRPQLQGHLADQARRS